MKISGKTKICIIIGNPVTHSLSPAMFNSAFEALGIDNKFVFVAADIRSENLIDAVKGIRALSVHAITVTHPYKESIIPLLDAVDETARRIGAVNTVINVDGKLIGSNTDWIGVYKPLEEKANLNKKSVAIIGAGGAARSAVYALTKKGAKVTVFNRTVSHAEKLAKEFDCDCESLENEKKLEEMGIIINTTTVSTNKNNSPISKDVLRDNQIVFDAVYSPYETKLLRDAKEKRATIIHGTEWLLHQGIAQFELYIQKKAPVDAMRSAIMECIKE